MTSASTLIGAGLRRLSRRALRFDSQLADVPAPAPGRRYLLYVHIPFCESLCPFCSFHRVHFRPARAHPYFDALRAEIQLYAERGFVFDEIYVGGGTPTVMPAELAGLLEHLGRRFPIRDIAVETNPNHLRPSIMKPLQDAGVTRLSVGVQSLDDRLLKHMGRYEPYGSAAEIMTRLAEFREAFATLNVDMIFNLPGQTAASFERDLALLRAEVRPSQVSFYPLMAVPATRERMRLEMGVAQANKERDFYHRIEVGLGSDYGPASAWSFARGRGRSDEYVVDRDDYVGAGSGAFGYLHGTLTANSFSLREYGDRVRAGSAGITRSRSFTRREQMYYQLLTGLFGLRLRKSRIVERFGASALQSLWPELAALRLAGLIEASPEALHLTPRGRYAWVVMMREFFTGVNQFREQMRENWRAGVQSADQSLSGRGDPV